MIKLKQGESIKALKRRHIFVLILELSTVAVFFLIIFIFMLYLLFSTWAWPQSFLEFYPDLENFNLRYAGVFIFSLALIFLWLIGFLMVAHYYLDLWVITSERTIHTELRGLFSRTYSSVYHDKIQDVTIDTHGIFPTFFRYGDLHVQTAGGFREFVCKQIPDPYGFKDIVLAAKQEYLRVLRT